MKPQHLNLISLTLTRTGVDFISSLKQVDLLGLQNPR